METWTRYNHQRIQIFTDEDSPLELESLSAFLYDLVIIHDRLLLFSSYYDYQVPFGLNFYRRFGRRIDKEDRLQISLITTQSPIIIEIGTAAVIATLFLTVLTIVQKLVDRPLERKIKELEYRKLLREELKHHYPQVSPDLKEHFITWLLKDVLRLGLNKQIKIKKLESESSQFSLDTEEQESHGHEFEDNDQNYQQRSA